MKYSFVADKAGTDIDREITITGVSNSVNNEYVVFQRGEYLKDDDNWGIYLELNDQGNSGYEMIKHCYLNSEKLIILLSKPIDRANNFTEIEVTLKIDKTMLKDLSEGLQKVFIDKLDLLYLDI